MQKSEKSIHQTIPLCVYVDPACDIQYASFYIRGLVSVLKKRIRFSSAYFNEFVHNQDFFAMVFQQGDHIHKVVIDYGDSPEIDEQARAWADLYCKINLSSSGDASGNVISIGPSFGIRIYSLPGTIFHGVVNLCKAWARIPDKRLFLSSYYAQLKRIRLAEYPHPPASKANYVYFASSLWKQEHEANLFRANFIRSCLRYPTIHFEGGFAPRSKKDIRGFESITMKERESTRVYLSKTNRSLISFNTPAVQSCHGWKLAEFLCLGQATISTPLKRTLPETLIDRTHLLYTDGTEADITGKIDQLISNPELRAALEKNARKYYEEHLTPEQTILRMLGALGISSVQRQNTVPE